MSQNLGQILVGLAALFSIAVMFSVARKVFTGALVPVEVRGLQQAQEKHIAELQAQNAILLEERNTEKAQLRQLVKDATEANFAVREFLTRYEALGGFAGGPTIGRLSEKSHRAPEG